MEEENRRVSKVSETEKVACSALSHQRVVSESAKSLAPRARGEPRDARAEVVPGAAVSL